MTTPINESVSVNLLSNHFKGLATPTSFYWRGRRYLMNKLGMRHVRREGRILFHVFSVTDGTNCYRLEFNTENLTWRLMEIENAN